jgi:hypothetical protein
MIRLDFPGYSGAGKLEPISWEEWFQNFDQNQLALVYEETTSQGQQSSFNKLIGRETVDLSTGQVKGPPRRRVKQGARTVREARQLRAGRVGAARKKKPARSAAAGARKAQAKAKPSTRRTSAKAATGRATTRGAKRKGTTGRGSRRVRQQAAGRTARPPRKRPRK